MADVPLRVVSENAEAERRITPSWTISTLKSKLEPVTGIPPGSQKLSLKTTAGSEPVPIEAPDEDNAYLSSFPLAPYAELRVSPAACVDRRAHPKTFSKLDKRCKRRKLSQELTFHTIILTLHRASCDPIHVLSVPLGQPCLMSSPAHRESRLPRLSLSFGRTWVWLRALYVGSDNCPSSRSRAANRMMRLPKPRNVRSRCFLGLSPQTCSTP